MCAQIGTWYASPNSYLLQQMVKVDMDGHSLLDESVVAGGGGGLRGGPWLKDDSVSHNDLLVAILNLCGEDVNTFGDLRHCSGTPLPNLTDSFGW